MRSDAEVTSDSVRQKKMRQIQALIDKANSTDFDAERESLLAKADMMMASYAIEQFELEFHKAAKDRSRQPVMREVKYGHTGDSDADNLLSDIFYNLCGLANVLIGWYGWRSSKVVGYEEDIEYVEMLMTGISLHMALAVEPKPSPDLSLEENLAALKEAGQKWQRIYELLVRAHPNDPHFAKGRCPERHEPYHYASCIVVEAPGAHPTEPDVYHFLGTMPRNIGVWFTGVYTRYCKENGRERHYSNPDVWRRNFQEGYALRVGKRIRQMKADRQSAGSGKELVLVSVTERLKESLYEFFPDLRPHPAECECDDCHVRKCRDRQCDRVQCVKNRRALLKASKAGARTFQERKVDWAAQNAGAAAGDRADLTGGRRNMGTTGVSGELNG